MIGNMATTGIGYILDLWIGDPHGWWHPVQGIGWLIERLEKLLRRMFPASGKGELVAGGFLVALVLLITGTVSTGILALAYRIHPIMGFCVSCGFSAWILATKSLKVESMKVYYALKDGEVEEARRAVSMIVGRDTNELTEEGIIKAAVETVAENTSDGIIAPLFYLFVGGPVAGFLYKAINTMDSMVGYRNKQYLYFGHVAARLDDLVNLIPARLSAILFIASACLTGLDGTQAYKIWRRDRRAHKSPNSAQGEAACAGALRIQLAGDAWYFGVLHKKPTIGDALHPVEPEDISRVNRLMLVSTALATVAGIGGMLCYTIAMGGISTETILSMIFPLM